jgi:transposase InsO family protein
MSIRRAIVDSDPATFNVTEFCRNHGVSTWFFWDLRRRHGVEGEVVLEPKSRAPHTVENKTPADVEDAIVAKRKQLEECGLDAGPATIAFHLEELPGLPSEATIWRILKARGCITADPSKAPKASQRSFTAPRANDCWQLDDTGWQLADGTEVKILNVVDDHARLAVACHALPACTGAAAFAVLAAAAVVLGWPARILSDNATSFRHVLADALHPIGVATRHSRPYHPQTCGKVERFHQTLKKWLAAQPPAGSIDELQTQLDWFRLIYNHHRPHRAIGRRLPAEAWTEAPKSGPAIQPINTPTTVYDGTVHDGKITIGHRYRITIGARHSGQRALTVITGTNCNVFIDGRHIHSLTIDPTRRTQPLHPRPSTERKDSRHA